MDWARAIPRILTLAAVLGLTSLPGCVQAVPEELVETLESLDRDLVAERAAEFAPDEYARFAQQWMALKARVDADEDLIRWPWEPNHLEADLRQLHDEGMHTALEVARRKDSQRLTAEDRLAHVEQRLQTLTTKIIEIDGRLVLGHKPVETDLLVKQARSFFDQGEFQRALHTANRAAQLLGAQRAVLNSELGRYADQERINAWQAMARRTIEWSRAHHSAAIVVSKADRILALYKDGRKVLSYPIRLGYNGIREKRYQGDGATPEGQYRITRKRGEGQTQFYRALVLDYPNADDQRRFKLARKAGRIPPERNIGGQIEIHGVENELMGQTLGCVMLDNPQMAKLFALVETGTPVSIVGALHPQNAVALTLAGLGDQEEDT